MTKYHKLSKNAERPALLLYCQNSKYIEMLDKKLNEELAEYQESKTLEELADLLEVIRAVAVARGSSIEEIESIRKEKAAARGGFKKRILLLEVQEEE